MSLKERIKTTMDTRRTRMAAAGKYLRQKNKDARQRLARTRTGRMLLRTAEWRLAVAGLVTSGAAALMMGGLLLAIAAGASWGVVCLILLCITKCLGLAFSLKVTTGIWLILCLLKMVFGK